MKVLIDMNLSPRWVAVLEQSGYQSIHWESLGSGSTPDEQIMSFAATHGFTVLTNDLDFGIRLALTKATSPSVIQLRCEDVRPEILGVRVTTVLAAAQEILDRGALITVREDQSRIRPLPLPSASI